MKYHVAEFDMSDPEQKAAYEDMWEQEHTIQNIERVHTDSGLVIYAEYWEEEVKKIEDADQKDPMLQAMQTATQGAPVVTASKS